MLSERVISTDAKWQVGHKYRFTFTINAWKIPFTDINLLSDEAKYRKVEETVDRFEQTHKDKLRIDNWNAYFIPGYVDKLEIDVTAIGNASPVLIIAAGLIAVAVIIGVIVLTDHVSELVETLDPLHIGVPGISLGLMGIGIVAFFVIGKLHAS